MKTLHLIRQFSDPVMGTHGYYDLDGARYFTVEQDWQENEVGKSCIPSGWYMVVPDRYNAGGYDALGITGVVGRSEILIHKGNVMDDVQGCIVPGTSRTMLSTRSSKGVKKWGVSDSKAAFDALMKWANKEKFVLRISWESVSD